VYTKGAMDFLMQNTTKVLYENGNIQDIDDDVDIPEFLGEEG
jgi:hypothetical protein